MAINRAGTLELVANRADDSISVLSIDGKSVKLVDTVSVASPAAAPGAQPPPALRRRDHPRRQACARRQVRRQPGGIARLRLDIERVEPARDVVVLAVDLGVADLLAVRPMASSRSSPIWAAGRMARSTPSRSSISRATPPRVIDQVVVGDGPEGLAVSPAGGYAASLLLNGTGGTPKSAFYRHEKSYVALLKIDGKTVRKVAQADVGGLAEGIAFNPDGHFLYVGNFVDGDIDILRVEGDTLTKVGNLALAGHPASMRGSTP
jgi:hypothetical protein